MDIYDFAVEFEQESRDLYLELASQTDDPGMRRILNGLAEDEAKHQRIVALMRDAAPTPPAPTPILATAKSVFASMRGQDIHVQGSQLDLYHQAQELERKSQAFYHDRAAQTADAAQKALLEQLADEERRHYFLLDHVIEFLSRPLSWIEDAEFNHLEDY